MFKCTSKIYYAVAFVCYNEKTRKTNINKMFNGIVILKWKHKIIVRNDVFYLFVQND